MIHYQSLFEEELMSAGGVKRKPPDNGGEGQKAKKRHPAEAERLLIRFCCHALTSAEALSGDCRLNAHGRVIIRTYEPLLPRTIILRPSNLFHHRQ